MSDHFPVLDIGKQMEIKENFLYAYVYKSLHSSRNKKTQCHAMSNIRWDEISRATDTQLAFYTFHKRLVEMYNDHFPKIKIKRKCTKKTWLPEGLIKIASNKRVKFI